MMIFAGEYLFEGTKSLKKSECDVIKIRDCPSLSYGFSFPLIPISSLIFMTSEFFLCDFVPPHINIFSSIALKLINIRWIRTGSVSHTEKLYIASYCIHFSTNRETNRCSGYRNLKLQKKNLTILNNRSV